MNKSAPVIFDGSSLSISPVIQAQMTSWKKRHLVADSVTFALSCQLPAWCVAAESHREYPTLSPFALTQETTIWVCTLYNSNPEQLLLLRWRFFFFLGAGIHYLITSPCWLQMIKCWTVWTWCFDLRLCFSSLICVCVCVFSKRFCFLLSGLVYLHVTWIPECSGWQRGEMRVHVGGWVDGCKAVLPQTL